MTPPKERARHSRRVRSTQTPNSPSELDAVERAAIEAQHFPLFELEALERRAGAGQTHRIQAESAGS